MSHSDDSAYVHWFLLKTVKCWTYFLFKYGAEERLSANSLKTLSLELGLKVFKGFFCDLTNIEKAGVALSERISLTIPHSPPEVICDASVTLCVYTECFCAFNSK